MTSRAHRSDTKNRIIESATTLMHERGYESVGVAEICQRAGVNKGSFYHFFRTKENLGLAVIEGYWAEHRAVFEDLRQTNEPLTELRRFFSTMAEHHRLEKAANGFIRGCLLGNLSLELAPQAPVVQQHLGRIFDEQVAVFAELIDRAIKNGDLPQQDAQQTAENAIAFLEGVVLISKVRNEPEVISAAEPAFLRLLGLATDG